MPFVNKCKVAPVKSSIINPVFFAAFFKNHVIESPKQSRNLNFLAVVKVLIEDQGSNYDMRFSKNRKVITEDGIEGRIDQQPQFKLLKNQRSKTARAFYK